MKKLFSVFAVLVIASMAWAAPDFPSQDFPKQDFPTQDFPKPDFPKQDFPSQDFPKPDFPTADFPQQDFPSQKQGAIATQINHAVAKQGTQSKAKQPSFNERLFVEVKITVKEPEQPNGDVVDTQYVCSGLIVNTKGTVAIRKDCVPLLEKAKKNHQSIKNVFVDMKELGTFEDGIPFFCEESDVNPDAFVVRENVLTYAPKIEAYSPIEAALKREFLFKDSLSDKKITKVLDSLPKVVIQKFVFFSHQ